MKQYKIEAKPNETIDLSDSSSILSDYQFNQFQYPSVPISKSPTIQDNIYDGNLQLSKDDTITDIDYTKVLTPSSIKRLMNRKSTFVSNKDCKNLKNILKNFSKQLFPSKKKQVKNYLIKSVDFKGLRPVFQYKNRNNFKQQHVYCW